MTGRTSRHSVLLVPKIPSPEHAAAEEEMERRLVK